MAILGVLIYGATHQQANSSISVKYTVPSYTVTFDPNGGELSTIGGGVSSKIVKLGDTYGDLPVPTRTGYSFLGWRGKNLLRVSDVLPTKMNRMGLEFVPNHFENSITVNGSKTQSGSDTLLYDFTSLCEAGKTYYGYEENPDPEQPISFTFYVYVNGTKLPTSFGSYTVTGEETEIYIYLEGLPDFEYKNRVIYPVLSTETIKSEPYYIESDTQFSTPSDRTLTAMWGTNILDGGALRTSTDLSKWTQDRIGKNMSSTESGPWATIATEDGYSCTKIDTTFNRNTYIYQSIKGKYEVQRLYSVTAKVKLKNMVAGVYDINDEYYTQPWLALYFNGENLSGNYLQVAYSCTLMNYNNEGWVDVRAVVITHPNEYSGVTASQVSFAYASVYLRNYTGDFYIRDFSMAKM